MNDSTHPTGEQANEPWTEKEVTAFSQALAAFQEGLPPRQREAFTAILKTAAPAAADEDVNGFVFNTSVLPALNTTTTIEEPKSQVAKPYQPNDAVSGTRTDKGTLGPRLHR